MNTEKDFYYIIADFFISIKQVNTLIDVETLCLRSKAFLPVKTAALIQIIFSDYR